MNLTILVQSFVYWRAIPRIRECSILEKSGMLRTVLYLMLMPVPTNFTAYHRWVTLWSGETQCRKVNKELRMFKPPIKKIDFATK